MKTCSLSSLGVNLAVWSLNKTLEQGFFPLFPGQRQWGGRKPHHAKPPIGKQRKLRELNAEAKDKARVFYVGQPQHAATDWY